MLLVCIRIYLSTRTHTHTHIYIYMYSFLPYKFLDLDIYHPDTICVNKNVRVRGYVSKAKGVREPKEKSGMRHSLLPRSFLFLLPTSILYIVENMSTYTHLCTDIVITTVAIKITQQVKHFYTNRSGAKCSLAAIIGVLAWRTRDIGQNFLPSFQTGCSSGHRYCHICFLI